MIRSNFLAVGMAAVLVLGGTAFAQGVPQTITLAHVDLTTLATGYRTSKIVGSNVFNEANENVGSIDDLIITPGDRVPYAVLSVGGFLGMGAKRVVVPASSLEVRDNKMVLQGATTVSLKELPDYKYSY
jgi:uncharacterized protein YrrD